MVDIPDWSWWRFVWGLVGTSALEILRLRNIIIASSSKRSSRSSRSRFGRDYYIISVLFVALGGAVAVAWGENNPIKCIWVGVSLPAIITSFASQVPKDGS